MPLDRDDPRRAAALAERPPQAAKRSRAGGHNRDEQTWKTQGGHYGHCHVPNNTHWDPAYTSAEVDLILQATAPAPALHPGAPAVMNDHGESGLSAHQVINTAGLDMVKGFEGLRLHAYEDVAGVWTIGYGHTRGVHAGMTIAEQQATDLLLEDLESTAILSKTPPPACRPAQTSTPRWCRCASTSVAAISRPRRCSSSTAPRTTPRPADTFLLWDKAHVDGQLVVLAGLQRRRQAERALYLTQDT